MISVSNDSFRPGEVVFAQRSLHNDGSLPGFPEGALLVEAGARGVVVKCGHVEHAPDVEVVLVRFETEGQVLGAPIGCFADELSQTALSG